MKKNIKNPDALLVAAIGRYQALASIGAALDRATSGTGPKSPARRAHERHEKKQMAAYDEITRLVLTTRAETMAGVIARLQHTSTSVDYGSAEWHFKALESIIADVKRLSYANDAKLLKLWEEIQTDSTAFNANAPEDGKEYARIGRAIMRKEKRLSRMIPTTPAGALVMLRFLSSLEWVDNGDGTTPPDSKFNHTNSPSVWAALVSYLSAGAIQPVKRTTNQPSPRREAA